MEILLEPFVFDESRLWGDFFINNLLDQFYCFLLCWQQTLCWGLHVLLISYL